MLKKMAVKEDLSSRMHAFLKLLNGPLPPQFCLMQTANDPGSAQKSEGIAGRLDTFAAHIARTLLP